MKLNVIYRNNKTGKALLDEIRSHWKEVTWEEFTLEDTLYVNIHLGDEGARYRRTLNNPTAIKRCMDLDNFLGVMKMNQIHAGYEDKAASKIYEVLLLDMKIIFIRQKVSGKGGDKSKYMRENQKTRVAEIARKSLLMSGLDLAVVRIQLNSRKRFQVIGVDPSPDLRDKDISRLIDEFDKMKNCKPREVKMGADPEFMIINYRTGKLVSASDFFPVQGMVGCDNIRLPNRQQRPVAELRPKPEKSPLQLVANIRYALIRANSMAAYKKVRWAAGSQPVPGFSIGGHIHFSNVDLNTALLRALDNYLGLLVFMIENPNTAVKRRKKYGLLGEYREKSYGGFEYRTPGSWLITQKIATAVICLAKIVATNYLQLQNNYLNIAEAQKAFYTGDKDYFMKDIDNIWKDLEQSYLYEKYAEEIEIIYWMIKNDIQWDEKMDIRKGWNLNSGSRRNNSRAALQNSRSVTQSPENTVSTTSASTAGRNRSNVRSSASRSSRTRRSSGSGRNINMENIARNTVVIQNQPMDTFPSRASGAQSGRVVAPGGVRRAIMVSS
ncbi:hypothetical protein ASZ90_018172 [hydrocarbon metagenome]|uniref:Phage phiEco32-like COOH.NH2 ligase-type 2 n=1 Tax=hydrocarbon metagenome TaxID=938273 RepID=A0A0W8E705_9ZZZZ